MNVAVIDSPKKIYVELTTRCNLQCTMCVKYTAGSCIPEEDMSLAVFKKILPSMENVDTVILNGIGESLLHPDLIEIVELARQKVPHGASIGLQSNGLLLTQNLSHSLIRAGLSTICLSVDRFEDPNLKTAGEHSFRAVQRAVDNLRLAKNEVHSDFSIGLEIVLTRQTIQDLPGLVGWAADNGIDYILSSNLILYDEAAQKECLFNSHPPEATELFYRYRDLAIARGLNFEEELSRHRRHIGTRIIKKLSGIINEMLEDAKSSDIQLNLDDLNHEDFKQSKKLEVIIDSAKALAQERGVDLFVPSLQATSERRCRFLDEKAVFVTTCGDVTPCHFLWHTYSCRILSDVGDVKKHVFGNVSDTPLTSIWHSGSYTDFRMEAARYDYTHCWTCSQGPCPTLLSDDGSYAKDCYGSQVPCGHCQWNLGGIRCL